MASSVPPTRRSAVPPYRAAERGTLGRNIGTVRRNDSGTPDLDALADKVLSRAAAERGSGTQAECSSEGCSVAPGTGGADLADHGACPHAVSRGRTVQCAACFLAANRQWRPRRRFGSLSASGVVLSMRRGDR